MVRILVSAIVCSFALSCVSRKDSYVQIRMVEESYREDAPVLTVPPTGDSIQLGEVLFDLGDLERAEVVKQEDRNGHDVWAVLSSAAAEILSEVTGKNKGRQLAILVGGELIMAPHIMAKINGGKVLLFYDLPKVEAEKWVETINERL